MKKLIFILLLFISAVAYGQAPVSPVGPITTNTVYYEPFSHNFWIYRGATYGWAQQFPMYFTTPQTITTNGNAFNITGLPLWNLIGRPAFLRIDPTTHQVTRDTTNYIQASYDSLRGGYNVPPSSGVTFFTSSAGSTVTDEFRVQDATTGREAGIKINGNGHTVSGLDGPNCAFIDGFSTQVSYGNTNASGVYYFFRGNSGAPWIDGKVDSAKRWMIFDTLKMPNIVTSSDTANNYPALIGTDGKVYKSAFKQGSGGGGGGGTTTNPLSLTYGFTGQPLSFNGSAAITGKIDSAVIQTVLNFFPKADTRYYTKTAADAKYALQATTVTASTGLTGSGSLAANITLKADTSILQTVLNFFPKGDTRYAKTSALSGYVPTSTTVAGFALSSNVTLANHVAGYALSGSNYNGSGAQTWIVDTTVVKSKAGFLTDYNNLVTTLNLKAPIASPTFTGVPAGPTATVGTNTTQLATTAFVLANGGGLSGLTANVYPVALTSTTIGNGNSIVQDDGHAHLTIGGAPTGITNMASSQFTTEMVTRGLTINGSGTTSDNGYLRLGALFAPTISGTGSNSGGSLATATYYFKLTVADNQNVESTPSAEISKSVTSGSSGSVTITFPQATIQPAAGYFLYVGTAAGAENKRIMLPSAYSMTGGNPATGSCTYVLTSYTAGTDIVPTINASSADYISGVNTVFSTMGTGIKTFASNTRNTQLGGTAGFVSTPADYTTAGTGLSLSRYSDAGITTTIGTYFASSTGNDNVLINGRYDIVIMPFGGEAIRAFNSGGNVGIHTGTTNHGQAFQVVGKEYLSQAAAGTANTDSIYVHDNTSKELRLISPTAFAPTSTTAITQAAADLTAQTSPGNITTFTVGASTATFDISIYINITAVSVDVVQGQITYTDENNTAQTVSLSNLSAVGNSTYNPVTIRAKNATVITVKTNLTTGAGSITFDAGSRISQL